MLKFYSVFKSSRFGTRPDVE